MFINKSAYVLLSCILVTLATFVLIYSSPDHFYITGGYLFAVLLTVFLSGRVYTWIFSGIAVLLITTGAFFPYRIYNSQHFTTEMFLSVALLMLIVFVVLYIKKLHGSIELEQQQVASNPAALHLFHYKREELIGNPVETLIPGRFHQKHEGYRNNFCHGPSNRAMGEGIKALQLRLKFPA